ncbi:MAG: hypothetical protein U9R19_14565 [Bacteroidota bacterium]|nr:hypothetical protein [Bacteroidota bacterium]
MESRIKELQEKYWAGETNVEEEKILKDYFRNEESATPEANYFDYLNQTGEQKLPVEFKIPGRKISLPKWFLAAAITIGIVIGVSFIRNMQVQNEFLVEDPQKAMEITRQALMTISSGMNKGVAYADNLEKFYKAQEIISE